MVPEAYSSMNRTKSRHLEYSLLAPWVSAGKALRNLFMEGRTVITIHLLYQAKIPLSAFGSASRMRKFHAERRVPALPFEFSESPLTVVINVLTMLKGWSSRYRHMQHLSQILSN